MTATLEDELNERLREIHGYYGTAFLAGVPKGLFDLMNPDGRPWVLDVMIREKKATGELEETYGDD